MAIRILLIFYIKSSASTSSPSHLCHGDTYKATSSTVSQKNTWSICVRDKDGGSTLQNLDMYLIRVARPKMASAFSSENMWFTSIVIKHEYVQESRLRIVGTNVNSSIILFKELTTQKDELIRE